MGATSEETIDAEPQASRGCGICAPCSMAGSYIMSFMASRDHEVEPQSPKTPTTPKSLARQRRIEMERQLMREHQEAAAAAGVESAADAAAAPRQESPVRVQQAVPKAAPVVAVAPPHTKSRFADSDEEEELQAQQEADRMKYQVKK